MTKRNLIDSVASAAGISKRAANDAINATFDNIARSLKREKRFQVPSFGSFSVRSRKARTGRNPQTGEAIKIRASKNVGFRAAAKLKHSL